jgi:hypothetical protein
MRSKVLDDGRRSAMLEQPFDADHGLSVAHPTMACGASHCDECTVMNAL